MAQNPVQDPIAALELAFVAGLAAVAYRKGLLNLSGSAAAFVIGGVIVLSTNIFWLFALVSLLGLAAVATRFKYAEKERRGTGEARGGTRRTRNVIANASVPAFVALFQAQIDSAFGPGIAALTYLGAVAAAAADTLASEFGGLSDRAVLITTLRRVPAGTDGGVSPTGQAAALGGAFVMGLLGLLLVGTVPFVLDTAVPAAPFEVRSLAVITIAGFAGCQADSVLGALLERRGVMTKEEVNFAGILVGALIAFGLGIALT